MLTKKQCNDPRFPGINTPDTASFVRCAGVYKIQKLLVYWCNVLVHGMAALKPCI